MEYMFIIFKVKVKGKQLYQIPFLHPISKGIYSRRIFSSLRVDPVLKGLCHSEKKSHKYCHLLKKWQKEHEDVPIHLGPVVQSIVSLTSLLRGQLIKGFRSL